MGRRARDEGIFISAFYEANEEQETMRRKLWNIIVPAEWFTNQYLTDHSSRTCMVTAAWLVFVQKAPQMPETAGSHCRCFISKMSCVYRRDVG